MPTVEDNAPQTAAPAHQSTPELSDDDVLSHPKYKELEEKHSAARKGMDESNLTKKQLQAELAKYKMLAGEEEKPTKEEEKPSFVTREELEERAWELAHTKDLELYADDQYEKDIEEGVPRTKALQYAKLRYEKGPSDIQVKRQQAMSSQGSTSTRDLENIDITDQDRKDMKLWGFSEETLLKHKRIKAERAGR